MSIFTAYIKFLNEILINIEIDPMKYLSNKSMGIAISLCVGYVKAKDRRCDKLCRSYVIRGV